MYSMRYRLGLAALLGVTALLYWPGLDGPFVLDDRAVFGVLLDARGLDLDRWRYIWSWPSPLGRPLAMASFLLSERIGGPVGWKGLNLLVHLLNGVLAWVVLRRVMALAGVDGPRGEGLALIVAGAWLLHPLSVSTVLYTVQRMALLATTFTLTGIWCYAELRARLIQGRRPGWPAAAALLSLLAASLGKETGLLLPMYWLALETWLFRGRGLSWPADRVDRLLPWLMAASMAAALLLPLTLYPVLLAGGYEIRDFGPAERLWTEARVVLRYLQMILAPVQNHMGFFHDDLAVSRGWLEPPGTLPAVVAVLLLPALALALRRRAPLAGLGLGLFLVGQLLESGAFGLELMFEHRNYLPSLGIILAAAMLIEAGVRTPRLRRALAALLLGALATLTGLRVQTWAGEESLYAYAYSHHPQSRRALLAYTDWLGSNGRGALALSLLADHREPWIGPHLLKMECQVLGAPREPMDRYLPAGPATDAELYALAAVMDMGARGRCRPGPDLVRLAPSILDTARARPGARGTLLTSAARLAHSRQQLETALALLEQAAALRPRDPMPLLLGAEWLYRAGLEQRAGAWLERGRLRARDSATDLGPVVAAVENLGQELRRQRAAGEDRQ